MNCAHQTSLSITNSQSLLKSCPLSQWCHPTISSSVVTFSLEKNKQQSMTNLDLSKNRDITLPTKVCLVKAMVFPVVIYGCESWNIKTAEHQRIDVFKLQCWRSLCESLGLQGDPTSPSWKRWDLGVYWKDWCSSWNPNTLATWCEELTHWKRLWCWEGDDRGWDGWMASPTGWTWV